MVFYLTGLKNTTVSCPGDEKGVGCHHYRTRIHHTLKKNPLRHADLAEEIIENVDDAIG